MADPGQEGASRVRSRWRVKVGRWGGFEHGGQTLLRTSTHVRRVVLLGWELRSVGGGGTTWEGAPVVVTSRALRVDAQCYLSKRTNEERERG